MGLGPWRQKKDFPCGLKNNDTTKIVGLIWHNTPHKYNTAQYNSILDKTDRLIKMYKHVGHTIFGRATIINTFILPKIIYIAAVTEPPPHFITSINKRIRNFIFKSTLRNIHHNTLIQNKIEGGIALQDIQTKIQALRLKYIGQITKTPHLYPLAIYLYGLKLNKLIKITNNTPHYFGTTTTPFYKSVTRILPSNEHLIHSKTKNIYTALITRKQIPLHTRIKWGRHLNITDFNNTFTNLHNKRNTPKSKEIAYRLIYNMTPTLERKKQNTNTPYCKMCNTYTQENEAHIYLHCPAVLPTKQTLKQIIDTITHSDTDINLAITLLKIPRHPVKATHDLNILTLLVYLQHIWQTYLKTRFDQKHYTSNTIEEIFRHTLDLQINTPQHT